MQRLQAFFCRPQPAKVNAQPVKLPTPLDPKDLSHVAGGGGSSLPVGGWV